METHLWSLSVTMLHDRLDDMKSAPRIEVFARSLAPDTARPQQDNLIRRLQRLETKGDIEAVDLYVSGGCVCESTAAAVDSGGSDRYGTVPPQPFRAIRGLGRRGRGQTRWISRQMCRFSDVQDNRDGPSVPTDSCRGVF